MLSPLQIEKEEQQALTEKQVAPRQDTSNYAADWVAQTAQDASAPFQVEDVKDVRLRISFIHNIELIFYLHSFIVHYCFSKKHITFFYV